MMTTKSTPDPKTLCKLCGRPKGDRKLSKVCRRCADGEATGRPITYRLIEDDYGCTGWYSLGWCAEVYDVDGGRMHCTPNHKSREAAKRDVQEWLEVNGFATQWS